MAGDKQATWKLQVDADARQAKEAADALEKYKEQIRASKDSIDEYRIALRSLTGTDEAVKASREALKKKILEEQNAISRANIGVRKAQAAYEVYSKKANEAGESSKNLGRAVSLVGGPLADVTEKVRSWRDVLGGTSPSLALVVAGAAAAVIAIAALTAAIVGGTVALASFTVQSANMLRAQGLAREALTGSADDASRFGTQIDALAARLPTARDKLNDLAVDVRRAFDGTRLSGQGIVDTVSAVATASAAAGDQAASALRGILDRGKLFGRTGVGLFELQGTGAPSFDAIAASLAKITSSSIPEARAAMQTFRVPIDEMAAALNDAASGKWSGVLAKKMLDVNTISLKFHENLTNLTRGVNLEPVLAALKQAADLFGQDSFLGSQLTEDFTAFGGVLGALAKAAMPTFVAAIKGGVIWGLELGNAMLSGALGVVWLKHKIDEFVPTVYLAQAALGALAVAAAVALAPLAVNAAIIAAPFVLGAVAISTVIALVYQLYKLWQEVDWTSLGRAILEGIGRGIDNAKAWLEAKVIAVANAVKGAFADVLGIRSPSKVFEVYGRQTGQGYAQGVASAAPQAERAVTQMASAPAEAAGSGAPPGAGGGSITIENHFHFPPGASAGEVAAVARQPFVLDGITRAVETALRAAGIPTSAPVPT